MRRQTRGARRTANPHPVLIVGPVGQVRPVGRAAAVRRVRRRHSPFALRYSLIEQGCWLLLGGLLVLSVWASPRMQPRRLIVHGAPPAARQELEARLRQLWQKQPYSIRLGAHALENEIKRFGWIAQAQVHPALPARLHLYIQPRQAFVEVRTDDALISSPELPASNSRSPSRASRIFIDAAGIVFQPPNPPDRAPGGVIYLSGSAALPPEGALQEGSPLWRAFELLRTLDQQDQPIRYVRTVRIEPNGELSLSCQAVGGATMLFRLGDAAHYQQQAQLIQLLLNSSPAQLAQWEYVDLKSPLHPAVKPLPKGSANQPSELSNLSDQEKAR